MKDSNVVGWNSRSETQRTKGKNQKQVGFRTKATEMSQQVTHVLIPTFSVDNSAVYILHDSFIDMKPKSLRTIQHLILSRRSGPLASCRYRPPPDSIGSRPFDCLFEIPTFTLFSKSMQCALRTPSCQRNARGTPAMT